jgi:regulator of protease activity HflC (stomatin/prohibitin superfamily)
MTERKVFKINGFLFLLLAIALIVGYAISFISSVQHDEAPTVGIIGILLGIILATGLRVVQPNEAAALVFFGSYLGTIRESGLWWSFPFTSNRKVSLRVSNFESEKLKVNDLEGNPIEIAAVIVYKVIDSSKALFDVERYNNFIAIQSETGLRHIASSYAYDSDNPEQHTLRGHSDEVADRLKQDLQKRLNVAGVEVMEARLTHLSYSPEIARAMLQRQQAKAILGARQIVVEGAVDMVQMAIEKLSRQGVVDLDDERKAAMINNLLVAIVAEQSASPIINTGSLY